MIYLVHECYCSDIKLQPKNWKTIKKITNDWFIYYRLYDLSSKQQGLHLKGKQVKVWGMNHYKTLADRRVATIQLLEDEVKKLHQYFNSIIGSNMYDNIMSTVDSSTPFLSQ